MKLIAVFPLLLCVTLCIHDASSQWEEEEPTAMQPITFLQAVLQSDFVRRKLEGVVDLIDLKLHHLRILKDLFTTENLITLRRTLEWGVSATNLFIRVLPDNPDHPSLATIFHQLLGTPIDEGTEETPIEIDFGGGSSGGSSFLDPYPPAPVFQNTIDGSSDDKTPLDDVSVGEIRVDRETTTKRPPAPLFESQLRFGGSSDEEGSADNEALPSERHSTVVEASAKEEGGPGGPTGRVRDGDRVVQVLLGPEELRLLKNHGMGPEEAIRLATELYKSRGNRAARAVLEREMHRVARTEGEQSPRAVSLARLIEKKYR